MEISAALWALWCGKDFTFFTFVTDVTVVWSVCLSVLLSHSCTLLRLLDRDTRMVPSNIILDGSRAAHEEIWGIELRIETDSQNLHLKLRPNHYG